MSGGNFTAWGVHDDIRRVDGHEGWRECFYAMHAAGGQSHE